MMRRSAYGRHQYDWFTLWDGRNVLCRWVDGQPAFRFRQAPTGLATRRQLRQAGLCPGGQPPYALLVWRANRAWAALYRLDLAKPKRVPTPAQRKALALAMEARRTCRECGEDVGYCVPTSTGACWNCFWKSEEEAAA